jgi:multidrug efflux system membrane fusion protein
MQSANFNKYKSWFLSGGIVIVVSLWLISGQFGDADESESLSDAALAASQTTKNAVRVRSQSAELVQRTISVNGKTAPARVVSLTAETDGRIVAIGAARGANIERGDTIVRMDERDRKARLAQAEATVKQREVEYQGRLQLKSEPCKPVLLKSATSSSVVIR